MKQEKSTLMKLADMTQFGVNLITPLVLLILLSLWLQNAQGWGGWTMAVALILGIASMGNTFYKYYRRFKDSGDKKTPSSFNRRR